MSQLHGRAWCFGDNVGAELIMPARFLRMPDDEMAGHVMAGVDSDFVSRISPGDFVIGGQNFGHGTSREHAASSLKHVGISAVIARSFGRIFFRNSINLGFPALECAEADQIRQGDELEVDLETGRITNLTQGVQYQTVPFSGHLLAMMQAGGLIPLIEARIRSGDLHPSSPPPMLM